jgi:FecR protein/Putative zinc-finger
VTPSCPRLFEAEAWRDGRLSGSEATRFRAHAATCSTCKRELESLNALGEALRAAEPATDELHVRRERTRLLAAFDAQLVRTSRRPVALLGLAVALALVVLVALWPKRAPVTMSAAPAKADPVLVRAGDSARWWRQSRSERERIVLESGELSIQIDHAGSPRGLLVVLPDGELEDIGTTFSVRAEAGHTTRVSVREGSVILRLRGEPALTLSAGQVWVPATPALSAPVPSASVASPLAVPAPPVAVPAPVASPAPAARSRSSNSSPSSSAFAAVPDAASEFRAALAALDRGDNSQAATLFGAFAASHALDSRAEDAAYLRVLALQRTGQQSAMQRAAGDYLRRYPRGFRRAEVESLAGAP